MTLVKVNRQPFQKPFDSFLEGIFDGFPSHWGADWNRRFNIVPVNIHETTDGFHLELNAPGRNKEDFKVNVENGTLTISFEKKQETETKEYKTLRREFSYEAFKRSFTLSEDVNADAIQAKYENGVLKLFLPKTEQKKPEVKEINIQ